MDIRRTRATGRAGWLVISALIAVMLHACKVTKHLEVVSADEVAATLVMQYEHGYEDYEVRWEEARAEAARRCRAWGRSRADFSDAQVECIASEHVVEQPGATGCIPPDPSQVEGMGTKVAEDRRSFRGVGTVGSSVCQEFLRAGCARWRVRYTVRCAD